MSFEDDWDKQWNSVWGYDDPEEDILHPEDIVGEDDWEPAGFEPVKRGRKNSSKQGLTKSEKKRKKELRDLKRGRRNYGPEDCEDDH